MYLYTKNFLKYIEIVGNGFKSMNLDIEGHFNEYVQYMLCNRNSNQWYSGS